MRNVEGAAAVFCLLSSVFCLLSSVFCPLSSVPLLQMTELVTLLLIFIGTAFGFLAVNLLVGRIVRPNRPTAEKDTVYECGEPAIGNSWIQFDLRFYVVA